MDIKKYKNMYDDIWPFAKTFKLDLKKECLEKGIPEQLIDRFMKSDDAIDRLTNIIS